MERTRSERRLHAEFICIEIVHHQTAKHVMTSGPENVLHRELQEMCQDEGLKFCVLIQEG